MTNIHTMITFSSLPDIPPDTRETNTVLRTEELTDYKSVDPEKCLNAVAKLALEHESGIWKIENKLSGKHAT